MDILVIEKGTGDLHYYAIAKGHKAVLIWAYEVDMEEFRITHEPRGSFPYLMPEQYTAIEALMRGE